MGKHESGAELYWLYRRDDTKIRVIKSSSEKTARMLLNVLPQGYELLDSYTDIEDVRERLGNE